jgi:hypothetical protein
MWAPLKLKRYAQPGRLRQLGQWSAMQITVRFGGSHPRGIRVVYRQMLCRSFGSTLKAGRPVLVHARVRGYSRFSAVQERF